MENKKLVKILLKDMGELEELIAEVKSTRQFDALAMEYIHTRARGVLQVLQMLDLKDEHVEEVMQKKGENIRESTEMPLKISPVQEGNQPDNGIKKISNIVSPDSREMETETGTKEVSDNSFTGEETKQPAGDTESGDDEGMLEDESETAGGSARLGDSFLKGKSINDLITEQQKLEFKLSNRPVNSIQSAIGINDRFQYIRELFDGDSEKFLETVKTLDSKENIKDAVDYLRTRFKWKKNETSLKFVNLVKRRFLNA
jgi:hypothetical protein